MFETKTEKVDSRNIYNKWFNNLYYSRNINLLGYQIKENGRDS
jgi:hypothetical protein